MNKASETYHKYDVFQAVTEFFHTGMQDKDQVQHKYQSSCMISWNP